MTQHDSLRNRVAQHKPKNIKSKIDDKDIYVAMGNVKNYLEKRFEINKTTYSRSYFL